VTPFRSCRSSLIRRTPASDVRPGMITATLRRPSGSRGLLDAVIRPFARPEPPGQGPRALPGRKIIEHHRRQPVNLLNRCSQRTASDSSVHGADDLVPVRGFSSPTSPSSNQDASCSPISQARRRRTPSSALRTLNAGKQVHVVSSPPRAHELLEEVAFPRSSCGRTPGRPMLSALLVLDHVRVRPRPWRGLVPGGGTSSLPIRTAGRKAVPVMGPRPIRTAPLLQGVPRRRLTRTILPAGGFSERRLQPQPQFSWQTDAVARGVPRPAFVYFELFWWFSAPTAADLDALRRRTRSPAAGPNRS